MNRKIILLLVISVFSFVGCAVATSTVTMTRSAYLRLADHKVVSGSAETRNFDFLLSSAFAAGMFALGYALIELRKLRDQV